jgi:hypothetical protein
MHVLFVKSLRLAVVASVLLASSTAYGDQASSARAAQGSGDRPAGEASEAEKPEHFRIGPLVGLSFPRPFAIEGFTKLEKLVGVGFEYSFMPRATIKSVDAGFDGVALDLRVFPFRGAFFLGARAGRQWLNANATITDARFGSIVESMDAATWFINPRAGFLYTFPNGITIGIDAGVQLPISPSYTRSGPATAAGLTSGLEIEGTLQLVADALGNTTTPTIDLLRLGLLF